MGGERPLKDFVQFVKFFLHFKQLSLYQHSQHTQAALTISGFVQYLVDFRLVGPQVLVSFQKPITLSQSLLQTHVASFRKCVKIFTASIDINLHGSSDSSWIISLSVENRSDSEMGTAVRIQRQVLMANSSKPWAKKPYKENVTY
jgi:hypothetical protein